MLRDLTLKKAFETPAKCLNSGCICCIGCLGFAEKGLLTEHREHITRHLSPYSCLILMLIGDIPEASIARKIVGRSNPLWTSPNLT